MSGDMTELGGQVIELADKGLSLFTKWPLNITIAAGLIGVGIGLVKGFLPKRKK